MWGNGKKHKSTARVSSLIGHQTEINGDVVFSGGLHVEGTVKGNIIARDDSDAMLTLSEPGTIEGEVWVPNVVINGTIIGDVHATERVELAANARVTGNVYYAMIEMVMGAEVNGGLIRQTEGMHRQPARKQNRERKEEASEANPEVAAMAVEKS